MKQRNIKTYHMSIEFVKKKTEIENRLLPQSMSMFPILEKGHRKYTHTLMNKVF